MKDRFFFLFLTIGLMIAYSSCLLAQRDFRPGYMVRKPNDTVRGLILYKALKTSGFCVFKPGLNDQPVEYRPTDILAFRFDDGRYFITKEVRLDSVKKPVFVEFLVKGKANVYYLRDETDHYFIEKGADSLVELSEKDKIITNEFGNAYVKSKQYHGKLKSVLSDCPDLFPEIDQASLSQSSLISLARNYHARVCTTELCIVYERKLNPVRLRVGFYAGITLNEVKFGTKLANPPGYDFLYQYGSQLVSNLVPGQVLGCRFELENLFAPFEHLNIVADIAVQRFSGYHLTELGAYDKITYNGTEYLMTWKNTDIFKNAVDINLKAYAIKLPLMFHYTFLLGKVRPYAGVGVMNMFIISQNSSFKLERFVLEFGKSIPTYHLGALGSAGMKFMLPKKHSLFFDLSYESTQSLNEYAALRFVNHLFALKAGFSF